METLRETPPATLKIKPLHPLFFAEISGVDLKQPLHSETVRAIIKAMDDHAVCLFRNQHLTNAEHIAFSRHFGPLQFAPKVGRNAERPRFDEPEIFDAGNLDERGNILPDNDLRRAYGLGNRLWHTDSSFNPVRAAYSLLAAHIVPPLGADTEFADMRAAYDALPEATKARIEDCVAEHSVWHSKVLAGYPEPTEEELKVRPPGRHRVAQTHPGSKRRTLYVASHASHILGMPVPEGRALLRELIEHATQPQFVHVHKWAVGDLVIWDNRCTLHRATPFEDLAERRDLRRTTARELPVPTA